MNEDDTSVPRPTTEPEPAPRPAARVWLTAEEAAQRARVGLKTIYGAVRSRRLRAACIGGRRALRFLPEWVDTWLIEASQPVDAVTRSPLRIAR